jgi:predicted permease
VLKSDGPAAGTPRHSSRLRRWFIGVQAAASIVLLVTAALFARAALHITRVDLGFDMDRLAAVAPGFSRSYPTAEIPAYWQLALERVRAIPSIERASLALYPPFGGAVSVTNLNRNGGPYQVFENRTDAAYFATAGLQIVRGRPYGAADVSANAPVAVVSEAIVRDFLDGQDPIGASLGVVLKDLSGVTIVGVVRDALTARVRGRGQGTIYRPLDPGSVAAARLVVRTDRPRGIVRELQNALVAVDARVQPNVAVVSDDVERYLNEPRVLAGLSGSIAGLALVLAVLGLYGVTAFVVGQRTREMGIRRAIGAPRGAIVGLVVRQSLAPVAIGLAVGLVLAVAGAPVLTPALSGISPYDPAAIGGAVLALFAAALAASVAPALRAATRDPVTVLRSGG